MMRLLAKIIAAAAIITLASCASTPAYGATDVTTIGNFYEGFNKTAAVGKVDSTYPNSWQPYPNGMSSKYYSDEIISTRNGYMFMKFDGKRGAAGVFGTKAKAWSHVGGTFSIRLRSMGSSNTGIAVLLWPTSEKAVDGEIDFPEGGLDSDTQIFHHWTIPGQESRAYNKNFGRLWGAFHTYTTQWEPGKFVKYYIDGKLKYTVTDNIPVGPHRFMIQTDNHGKPGELAINWVRTTE